MRANSRPGKTYPYVVDGIKKRYILNLNCVHNLQKHLESAAVFGQSGECGSLWPVHGGFSGPKVVLIQPNQRHWENYLNCSSIMFNDPWIIIA